MHHNRHFPDRSAFGAFGQYVRLRIINSLEALPRDRRIPKFRQITVAFGCPEPVETLRATGDGRTDQERITDAVRQRVIAVGAASAAVPATAMPDPPAGQTDSIRR
jgi:hypothetical protein